MTITRNIHLNFLWLVPLILFNEILKETRYLKVKRFCESWKAMETYEKLQNYYFLWWSYAEISLLFNEQLKLKFCKLILRFHWFTQCWFLFLYFPSLSLNYSSEKYCQLGFVVFLKGIILTQTIEQV